jgi:predicted nucleic acid-binding protein
LIASVQPVIDDMIARAGFWVDSELYDRLLKEAGE